MDATLTGLHLLIVEDDALLRKRIAARLEDLGADVTTAGDLATARRFFADLVFDFALLDVHLPDGVITDVLRDNAVPTSTGIIVMTAQGGVEGAVEAMRLGALDYLVKPFDPAELPLVLERARRSRQAVRLRQHREQPADQLFFGDALANMKRQLDKILESDRRMESRLPPVLIQGETGTGKTSIARWLHQNGPRANKEMVEVNCSALPETLAESELFGHERGAFTDARSARIGLFEAASGGTLFLDELPSLSLPLQAKVLTAIEDRRIRRVGGNKSIQVDVRVVAASNQQLRERVAQRLFREDLLHRLDLFRVTIPPLRDWGHDREALTEQIMRRICQRHRVPRRHITPQGYQRMAAYEWPGNIRELSHELERAIVFDESLELDFSHLASDHPGLDAPSGSAKDWLNSQALFEDFALEDAIDRIIEVALKRTKGNVSAAARLLQVPRDYIRYRQRKQKRSGK